jgi:hypothetical protein
MPAHSQIETYTKRFSETVEAGWESLRALHELGYELVAHGEQELLFLRASTAIVPIAMSGRLVWMHSMSIPVHRVNLNMRLMRGEPYFTDALAVAAWWEIEVANNPAPETFYPQSTPPDAHVHAPVMPTGPSPQILHAPWNNPPPPTWDGQVSAKQQAEMEAFIRGMNGGRV